MAVSNDGTVSFMNGIHHALFTQYPKNLHQPLDKAPETYTFSIARNVSSNMQAVRFNRKQAFYRCVQTMEVLKFRHSHKKKSTKVLSCLDHLLLEEEKDILLFLLSLSGMLQTAKCLQKDEHWHQSAKRTQCSVRRIFFVTLPPLQTTAPSLHHREENLRTERVTVDISIKFIQRKIFFSNFRKCCIFIKIFVM